MKAVIDLLEGAELDHYFNHSFAGGTGANSQSDGLWNSGDDWRPAIVEFLRREEADRTDERQKTATLLLDTRSANKSVAALLIRMCSKMADQTQGTEAVHVLAKNMRNANKREKALTAQLRSELQAEQLAHHQTVLSATYQTDKAALWRERAMQLGDSGEATDVNGGAQVAADSAAAELAELQQMQLQQRAVHLEGREQAAAVREQAAAVRERGTAERERAVVEREQAAVEREQAAVERAAVQEAQCAVREQQAVQMVQDSGGGANSRSVQEALVRAQQLRRQQAARIEELQASAAAEREEAAAAHDELIQWRAGSALEAAEAVRVSQLEAELEAHTAQLEETVLSLVQQQALVERMDNQLACSTNRATNKQLENEMDKIQVLVLLLLLLLLLVVLLLLLLLLVLVLVLLLLLLLLLLMVLLMLLLTMMMMMLMMMMMMVMVMVS